MTNIKYSKHVSSVQISHHQVGDGYTGRM